jgi:thiol-disulfide isomerase/thioredoxin
MENNTTHEHESQEHNVVHHKPKKSKMNVWMAAAVIFFIATVVLGSILFMQQKKLGTMLKPSDVATKTIKYINDNFDATKKSNLKQMYDNLIVLYKFDVNYNNQVVPAYVSADGKLFFASEPIDMSKNLDGSSNTGTPSAPTGTTVTGNFTQVTDATVCKENGKPIVYFFGSKTCPHCQWEKPVIEAVVKSFGSAISFHENIDSTVDQDIFAKYDTTGGVPAIVLGCKYYRVGSGEQDGEATETANLTKHICDLTGNQPASVCK